MESRHPEGALIGYLRGELDARERDRVGRHLEECADCRASADSFAALLAQLPSRLDELPAPEATAYRAEVGRKLAAREQARPRQWRTGALWATLATGAVAAVLAASLLMVRSRSVPPVDQLASEPPIATDVGLLQNYALVEHLDLLENYDVIEHLDELTPPAEKHESPS